MFRLLMALTGVAFLAIPASAQNGHPWTLKEMNRTIDQTNFIVGRGCSGTLISTDYRLVLTAHHCVKPYLRVVTEEKVDKDGEVKKVKREIREKITISQKQYRDHEQVGALAYQTQIVAYKKERDIALLQLVGKDLRSTINAKVLPPDKKVYRGDRVTAVGNPQGLDASVTSGVVSSTTRSFKLSWAGHEPVPMIQYDAAGAPGSSGGALYDSAGYLIGVTVAGHSNGDIVLAVPVKDVRELLKASCYAQVYDPEADDEKCRKDAE